MTTITFVTTNSGKFDAVSRYFKELSPTIQLQQAAIELPEIQSLNVHEIAHHKAVHAWELLQRPLIIDDGGIYLDGYNQFPGPLAKFVFQGIGLEGIWKLAQDNPHGYFLCLLVYVDGPHSMHTFQGVSNGAIIKPRHPVKDLHLPFTEIFIPEGFTKTYAEYKGTPDELIFNHRYKAVKKLAEFLRRS